ncbi:GLE1-like protein-domain-containing protein [Chytriomyces sp. MP71]|nr:GLE1-like protein-domain-containing protein [Chytriomyces sp. MP71]
MVKFGVPVDDDETELQSQRVPAERPVKAGKMGSGVAREFTAAAKAASRADGTHAQRVALNAIAWRSVEGAFAAAFHELELGSRLDGDGARNPQKIEPDFSPEREQRRIREVRLQSTVKPVQLIRERGSQRDSLLKQVVDRNTAMAKVPPIPHLLEDSLKKWRIDDEKAKVKEEGERRDKQEKEAKEKNEKEKEEKEKAQRVKDANEAKEKEKAAQRAQDLAQQRQVMPPAIQPQVSKPPAQPAPPPPFQSAPPAPAVTISQLSQSAQPASSTVPNGIIASEQAWQTASKYFDLLRDIKTNIKPVVARTPVYQGMTGNKPRMTIMKAVSQINNVRPHLSRTARSIHVVLVEARNTSPDLFYIYLLDATAKYFVLQADREVSVHSSKATGVAQAVMILCEGHPKLLGILLGRLMKRCPFTVPMYYKRMEGENVDDFNRRRRMKSDMDGNWESEDNYNERMCGMVGFYGGMTQITTNSAYYEIDFGWQWLARMLNLSPRPLSVLLIFRFLQIAGPRFMAAYGVQAHKLMRYIHGVYVQRMIERGGDFLAPAVRLQVLFEGEDGFLHTGRMKTLHAAAITDD